MKCVLFSTIVVALFVLLASGVQAQSVIGVSPGTVAFKNVLRGGYAERPLTITTDSPSSYTIKVEALGSIADWINFSSLSLTISQTSLGRTMIIVQPPDDVPNGNYTGIVRVSRSISSAGEEGHATGTIIAVIDVVVDVEIVDAQYVACSARDFLIDSAEKNDNLTLQLQVSNEGNVRLRPRISTSIWDRDQTAIVSSMEFLGSELLPTRQKEYSFFVPTGELALGQYWIDVAAVDCYATQTLTFDILEPGSLKVQGVLLSIISRINPYVDDTIPIVANFQNTGEKSVNAQFRGTISKNGKIVELLESEQELVDIGALSNFTLFFTPREIGTYVVSGRVYYEKKKTFESSTTITVVPAKSLAHLSLVLYGAVAALIGYLLYKIHTERKLKRMQLRRLIHHEL